MDVNPGLLACKFTIDDLVPGDVMFAMSSVTGTKGLLPLRNDDQNVIVETFATSTWNKKLEKISRISPK